VNSARLDFVHQMRCTSLPILNEHDINTLHFFWLSCRQFAVQLYLVPIRSSAKMVRLDWIWGCTRNCRKLVACLDNNITSKLQANNQRSHHGNLLFSPSSSLQPSHLLISYIRLPSAPKRKRTQTQMQNADMIRAWAGDGQKQIEMAQYCTWRYLAKT
jgi:hypothetical protein